MAVAVADPQSGHLCICDICNCGKHKCPHSNGNILDQGEGFQNATEYGNSYIGRSIDPVKSYKPQQTAFQSADPLDTLTTHNSDFRPWDVKAPQSYKPATTAFRSVDPLDTVTTHNADFKAWSIEPKNQPFRPKSSRYFPSGTFEGITETSDKYVGHAVEAPKSYKPLQQYNPSGTPFDDVTTYREGYVPRQVELPKSFKPAVTAFQSAAPFDANTTYQGDYVNKGRLEPCPVELIQRGRNQNFRYIGQDKTGHKFYQRVDLAGVQQAFGGAAASIRNVEPIRNQMPPIQV